MCWLDVERCKSELDSRYTVINSFYTTLPENLSFTKECTLTWAVPAAVGEYWEFRCRLSTWPTTSGGSGAPLVSPSARFLIQYSGAIESEDIDKGARPLLLLLPFVFSLFVEYTTHQQPFHLTIKFLSVKTVGRLSVMRTASRHYITPGCGCIRHPSAVRCSLHSHWASVSRWSLALEFSLLFFSPLSLHFFSVRYGKIVDFFFPYFFVQCDNRSMLK